MKSIGIAASVVVFLVSTQAWAASTWTDGADPDENYATAGNWDSAPASGDDVVFATAGNRAASAADITVGQITFNATNDFCARRRR